MQSAYQYKNSALTFKDIDSTKMVVSGYLSAFDIKDSYNEIAVKGSFKKSIDENLSRIKYLQNHDITMPLGPYQELREDDYGLFYRAEVLPTSYGKDFMVLAEGGIIKEHSIGYKEVKVKEEGGTKYILEHKLYEGSALTGWGVNQFTPLISTQKSILEITNRIKQIETFCRNTDATDSTIELLLIEVKQLHQVIIDIEKSTQPEQSTKPRNALDLTAIAHIFKTN